MFFSYVFTPFLPRGVFFGECRRSQIGGCSGITVCLSGCFFPRKKLHLNSMYSGVCCFGASPRVTSFQQNLIKIFLS